MKAKNIGKKTRDLGNMLRWGEKSESESVVCFCSNRGVHIEGRTKGKVRQNPSGFYIFHPL